MEHQPPPFFKRGPAPLVRLAFFASLSIALLVADARFHYAEVLRSALAAAVYPLQSVATAPARLLDRIAGVDQVDEADPLDHPAAVDVKAGDDPHLQHGAT